MRIDAPSFVPGGSCFLKHAKPIAIGKGHEAVVQSKHHPENAVEAELHFEDAFSDDGHGHGPHGLSCSPATSDYSVHSCASKSCSRMPSVEEESENALDGSEEQQCACNEAAAEQAAGLRGADGAETPAPSARPAEELEEPNTLQRAKAQLETEALLCTNVTSYTAPAAKVGPQDFDMLRVVGQGAFGKVFQVQHKQTQQVYAMKVMRKDRIMQKEHSEYVRAERDVLTAVVHPYIVTMRFSFQTPTRLYLVLDFINGGHLFFNLYRQGVFGEDVARLYTAEIVSAIAYLHTLGIAHRDLKPENVLLDNQGHIKLTDFGLAKFNMSCDDQRSNSFIGTMEYMAPEIIDGKGHTKSVDWWSTGILLYEMLCGVPPFRAKSRNQLQQQILGAKAKYPKFLSCDALSLLKGLLMRDPAKRLGAGPNGSDAIKKHPFFKSINWAKLERREIESKFKPEVSNARDTNNFDKLWTDAPVVESPCGTPGAGPGLAAGTPTSGATREDPFKGFTYVAPCFLETGVFTNSSGGAAASAAATAVAVAKGGDAMVQLSPLAPAAKRVLGFNVVPSPSGTPA